VRGGVLTLVAAGALTATAAGAAPVPPLTALARPGFAGARPVALTVKARFAELQCGRVVRGPLVLGLPPAERVPRRIAASAVTIDGVPVAAVRVSGETLTLQPQPPRGAICDVIGPGTVTVAVKRGAGVGNPRRAGSYRVRLRLGAQTVTGRLVVSR